MYDTVAPDYEVAYADHVPTFDRAVLEAFVGQVRGAVLDVGCGPGQVGAYLAARGLVVAGCDLSVGMLAVARRRAPERPLVAADVCRLPVTDGAFGGAVAFYSLHHLDRTDLPVALAEIRRVVVRGGLFVACTHLGDGDVHLDELLGHAVELHAALYRLHDFLRALGDAGLAPEEVRQRGPLPGEADTERVYAICRSR